MTTPLKSNERDAEECDTESLLGIVRFFGASVPPKKARPLYGPRSRCKGAARVWEDPCHRREECYGCDCGNEVRAVYPTSVVRNDVLRTSTDVRFTSESGHR